MTKDELFKLKEYFDSISNMNGEITAKDFQHAFENKPHMKKVLSSVYNFLDTKQIGKITFNAFIQRLYPHIYEVSINEQSKSENC